MAFAYSMVSSATDPVPGSGAVVTSSAQASDILRFGRLAIMVWWAFFSFNSVHQWVSSASWKVVRAPSRALGLLDNETALPSPRRRIMRSKPISKSSRRGPSPRITRRAPYASSSDCSSVYATIGMYGSITGLPNGLPRLSNPSHLTGASWCSSQADIQAASSVFASPLAKLRPTRLNLRRPSSVCPFGNTS